MKRIWKSRALRSELAENLIDEILMQRGAVSEQAKQKFLDPRFGDALDPFKLVDMGKAVERIKSALEKNEKITIYADYDADAVTAAAVLLRLFEHLGCKKIDYYIPDRFSEGYGMNPEAIASLSQGGTSLIITVDCGINAVESAELARQMGIDLIITDHHRLTGPLPQACAVVNPHRPDDEYPFKDLTGVGAAFKLAQALLSRMNNGWEKWLLDLVAIGTVADCQSLLEENRIFVKWGIAVMQKTKWVGLRELLKIAGIWQTPIDTYKIGFIIAPRINAAGRIEHANLALELLLTDDEERAVQLAEKLDDLNRKRQDLTQTILSEAREQLAGTATDKKILLASGENWPKGIVGLVAGKLTEEYARPVLVLDRGAKEATGSARSVGGFNIIEAISHSREILMKYGGHPMAAGFTLLSEHIETFHRNLLEYAETAISEDDLSPVIYYDAELLLSEITANLVDFLEKLAPFGLGNPRPRFRLNNLVAKNSVKIGADLKHLRIYVEDGGASYSCIGFNQGFWADKLGNGSKIDVICEPQYNEWNGNRNIQLKIVDINFSEPNS